MRIPEERCRRGIAMAGTFIQSGQPPDAGGPRDVAPKPVRAHRYAAAFGLAQPTYRPPGWPERYVVYAPLQLPQGP